MLQQQPLQKALDHRHSTSLSFDAPCLRIFLKYAHKPILPFIKKQFLSQRVMPKMLFYQLL